MAVEETKTKLQLGVPVHKQVSLLGSGSPAVFAVSQPLSVNKEIGFGVILFLVILFYFPLQVFASEQDFH